MKRVPVMATMLVIVATALMIALGVWQLDRRQQKEALLTQLAANAALPPIVLPAGEDFERSLFRRASADCARVTGWSTETGRSVNGGVGWRKLATCARAAGSRFVVDTGVARDPAATPVWPGGAVAGTIADAPRHESVLAMAFGGPRAVLPMLIADTPLPGLQPSVKPTLDSVPNNHLAYAVQWFVFAAIAVTIYLIALRRRWAQ